MRAIDKRLPAAREKLRPRANRFLKTADQLAKVSSSDFVELRLGLPQSEDFEPTPTASHPRESGRILDTA